MAFSFKPSSSRYSSFDSRSSTTSQISDPSSSAELKNPSHPQSSFKRLIRSSRPAAPRPRMSSDLGSVTPENSKENGIVKVKNEQNLSALVKRFVETRYRSKPNAGAVANRTALVIPADLIAEDLKKTTRKAATNFTALHRKMFSKGSGSSVGGFREKKKAVLTEVKANTRTLAMVLRSERELLSQNKEMEEEISELKSILEHKINEVCRLLIPFS